MIRLQLVDQTHPVCRSVSGGDTARSMQLPPRAFLFRYRYVDWEVPEAVIAVEDERLVGFFRFDHVKPMTGIISKAGTIRAAGTWVDPGYRRRGVATSMWSYAVQRTKTPKVEVLTVTKAGTALVDALSVHHVVGRVLNVKDDDQS